MKVLLTSAVGGGGVDVWMENARSALAGAGVEVDFELYPPPVRFFPPLARLWGSRARGAGADVIHSSERMGFALRRPGRPLVVTVHHLVADPLVAGGRSWAQAAFHEIETLYARLSIRRATAVVAVSAYTAARVREIAGRADTRVVLNGVDTGFFHPAPSAGAGATTAPDRQFTALFVGNLTRRKGADLLPEIRAALGPGFELRFTAGLRTRLPAVLAPAPGLVPLGRLTRDELREEYRRTDVLLFPSRLEGFGLAAAEAMACGKPVVCTRCSSLPELVIEGEGGRLVEPGDTAGFAAALRGLRDSPEIARRMGEFNRERACRLFSLETMARSYLSIYESLLAR